MVQQALNHVFSFASTKDIYITQYPYANTESDPHTVTKLNLVESWEGFLTFGHQGMDKATDLRVGKWLHCSALELLLYLQESDYQWHKCCKLDEGGKGRQARCWAASLSRGNHLGAVFLKYISFQEMLKLNYLQQITLSFVRRYLKQAFNLVSHHHGRTNCAL